MIQKIKYGLYYKDRLFIWLNKELYRYPCEIRGRHYTLRKISTSIKGNRLYYRLCKDWVSEKRIEALTTAVNVEPITTLKDNDLPF